MHKLLDMEEGVAYLARKGYPIAKSSLYSRHRAGTGPAAVFIAERRMYAPADLDAWCENEIRKTSRRGRLPGFKAARKQPSVRAVLAGAILEAAPR
jgi:hypothetical protein